MSSPVPIPALAGISIPISAIGITSYWLYVKLSSQDRADLKLINLLLFQAFITGALLVGAILHMAAYGVSVPLLASMAVYIVFTSICSWVFFNKKKMSNEDAASKKDRILALVIQLLAMLVAIAILGYFYAQTLKGSSSTEGSYKFSFPKMAIPGRKSS